MLNVTVGELGQMTAINSNRCYLKLSFIRKSFENNSQNHFFFTSFIKLVKCQIKLRVTGTYTILNMVFKFYTISL